MKTILYLNFDANGFKSNIIFLELLLYCVLIDDQDGLAEYIYDYSNYEESMNGDDFAFYADHLFTLARDQWDILLRSILPPVKKLLTEKNYHIENTIIKQSYVVFELEIYEYD